MRGILYLKDPLRGTEKMHTGNTKGLVFRENESLLSQAQTALWQMRKTCDWICAAGEGNAADIALCLAAQLPVDRVALIAPPQKRSKLPRELCRLRAFARRNLSLVAAEILLIGADSAPIQALLRGIGHRRVCVLDDFPSCGLDAPWEHLLENNLLIPWKCV